MARAGSAFGNQVEVIHDVPLNRSRGKRVKPPEGFVGDYNHGPTEALDVLREALKTAPPVANIVDEPGPPPMPDLTVNRGAATYSAYLKFLRLQEATLPRRYGEPEAEIQARRAAQRRYSNALSHGPRPA